jgi:hypothetical protein
VRNIEKSLMPYVTLIANVGETEKQSSPETQIVPLTPASVDAFWIRLEILHVV